MMNNWHWDYEETYYQIYNDDESIVLIAPETNENDAAIREIVERLNAVL